MIDYLCMAEVAHSHNRGPPDGSRVEHAIVEYAALSRPVIQLTKIIVSVTV